MTTTQEVGHIEARTLRDAFGKFPTGVVAVCSLSEAAEPVGMAVSAFMPVSVDPPLLSICIQKSSTTWPRLRESGAIGVSVLSRAQKGHAQRLSSKTGDRFVDIDMLALPSRAIVLEDAHAWFECGIEAEHDAGDHVIVVLRIHAISVEGDAEDPMVFFASRFRGIRPQGGQHQTTYQFDAPIPIKKKVV